MATAKQIDAYLRRHQSPLAGYGQTFVNAARRNGLPPGLLVAIAGAESSFGHINSGAHNAWGWGPGIDFPSWQAAIQSVAKGLKTGYFDQGRTTISAIGAKWAPAGAGNDPSNLNSNWVRNVKKFMSELGTSVPTGGSVSPVQATQGVPGLSGPNTSSGNVGSIPDFVLGSGVGGGHYDPLKALADLTNTVAAGAHAAAPGIQSATVPGSTPAPISTHGGITYSGQSLTHQTDGLAGYPAVDIFAPAGTPFLAPEAGRIVRISGHPGTTSGNVFGESVYFQGVSGKTYFLTHLGTTAPIGSYRRGQALGRVSRWTSGSSHVHVGIHR